MPVLVVAPTRRELGGINSTYDALLNTLVVGLGKGSSVSLEATLREAPASVIFSLGFAGALRPGLNTGDVLVCDRVLLDSDNGTIAIEPSSPDPFPATTRGVLLTTPKALLKANEKRERGHARTADVVDLEGYWLAKVAGEHQTPFVAVRAVIDRVQDNLPSMVQAIIDDGGAHELRHAAMALLRPSEALRLPALALRSRIAVRSLRRATRTILAWAANERALNA